jgi:hypothetical protein
MQTQTAKMIYPTEAVANMLCGKLTKSKGKHVVMKVTTGFQVCPVTVLKGYVGQKPGPLPTKEQAIPMKPSKTMNGDTVVLTFKFKADHPKTVHVIADNDGEVKWLHKSVMIDYKADPSTGLVEVKYLRKVAEKKGIVAWSMGQLAAKEA